MNRPLTLQSRLALIVLAMGGVLLATAILGISYGSSGVRFDEVLRFLMGREGADSVAATIIREIRLPRVILAAVVGATLALGGVVFQALLRNPLAEPYILGVSGGSAIGAITGLLLGFSPFPGVALASFGGSMLVLASLLALASGGSFVRRDSLLLGGVMINALCGAIIMFLISLARSAEVHQVLFWMMGDLSVFSFKQLPVLLAVLPCFVLIFIMARPMNLLLMGRENAALLGVDVNLVSNLLLVATTFMVSVAVSHSGLIGFVGLVVPHMLRLLIGPDHRLLVPASILGGASFLIVCDLLARFLPGTGEIPVGVITAMIGAPLFIFMLWRIRK